MRLLLVIARLPPSKPYIFANVTRRRIAPIDCDAMKISSRFDQKTSSPARSPCPKLPSLGSDEPTCQSCHTGTALHNNGQIRYLSVFSEDGQSRQAVDDTFATSPDTPAPGLSLYQFSTGHGGLFCESCHGSTHAEFPSSHANDNIQSLQHQGHVGMLADCNACHAQTPDTITGLRRAVPRCCMRLTTSWPM